VYEASLAISLKQNVISLNTTLDSNCYTNEGCVTLWPCLTVDLWWKFTILEHKYKSDSSTLGKGHWIKCCRDNGNSLRTWGTNQECIGRLWELNVNILKT